MVVKDMCPELCSFEPSRQNSYCCGAALVDKARRNEEAWFMRDTCGEESMRTLLEHIICSIELSHCRAYFAKNIVFG